MARKLKVYRTPIGFHDAYVAAPSQKAALAAWGSDANLFARGIAEEVTDTKLTAEPLAHPGDVIRVARGSDAEHMAALPERSKAKPRSSVSRSEPPTKPRTPRPSRKPLDAAEAALDAAQADAEERERDLAKREAAIAAERKSFDRDIAAKRRKLETDRDDAKAAYTLALEDWEP